MLGDCSVSVSVSVSVMALVALADTLVNNAMETAKESEFFYCICLF